MGCFAYHKARIAKFLKSYWIIIGPILFSPLLFFGKPLQCVWCICLIASYWIAGVGPLGVTCLLPVFLFPFFGFTSAQKVVSFFFKDTSVMLFITLGMGIVVEEVNLHRRIALKMLCWMGTRPNRLLFGFMCVTCFVSFFLTDSAATALMLPFALAILEAKESGKMTTPDSETSTRPTASTNPSNDTPQKNAGNKSLSLASQSGKAAVSSPETSSRKSSNKSQKKSSSQKPSSSKKQSSARKPGGAEQPTTTTIETNAFATDAQKSQERLDKAEIVRKNLGFRKAMILACSHASLIGGTAIITSTGPNLIFKGELETRSHSQDNHPPFFPIELHVSYFQWAAMAIPPAFLYLVASYAVLIVCFCGCGELLLWRKPGAEEHRQQLNIRAIIHNSYEDLGPMTFAETSVMSWFGVLVLLWATRDLGFIPGWGDLIFEPAHAKMMTESVAGIVVLYVMFLWPRYGFGDEQRSRRPINAKENDRILTWALIQQKLSWSIIMLVGCGFCISEAVKGSGLAKEVELLVRGLSGIHPIMVQLILLTAVVAMTEFMSNAGTANIFVPLSMEAAKGLNWHPFRLGLPAAIGPSLAFMLPMATPPNALVYDTGYISFFELFYTGGVLNIFCIAVTIVNMNTWAYWLLNMDVDIWAIATPMTPTNATTMAPINATITAAPSVAQFDL